MPVHRARALLSVLVALCATTPAEGAETACATLAREIRSRSWRVADGGPILQSLATRAPGTLRLDSGKPFTAAAFRELQAEPALAEALVDLQNRAMIGELGASGGAVAVIEGTLRCRSFVFFQRRGGQARLVAGPRIFEKGAPNLCWTDYAWIGEVGGQPAAIEEAVDIRSGRHLIYVVAWRDGAWGRTCELKVRFRRELRLEASFCRPGTPCQALGASALALARRIEAGQPVPPASAELRRLAGATKSLHEVPSFDAETVAYGQITDPWLVGLPKGRLGVLGRGHLGWREWPGHVFAVWEPVEDKLEPVAGFRLRWMQGRLLSLSVKP